MAASVTTVLFDLDETLCEQPIPVSERLGKAFERAGVEPFFAAADYLRLVEEFGGTESDIRRRERCFEILARENGLDERVGLRVADACEAVTDYTAVRFLPGAEDTLETLGERYRVGLVTNGGPDTQSPKIDALDIRERVETVVLAGWETAAKPDPEPFERAVADLDATPAETAYVGNSLTCDVAGAGKAGLQSVWIPYGEDEDPGTYDPDYALDSVRDLLAEPWAE